MNKKPLLERVKKLHCQTMLPNEMQTKERIEWVKKDMGENLIKELLKEGLIKEEIKDTPDYKLLKMQLLVIEPEEPDESDDC